MDSLRKLHCYNCSLLIEISKMDSLQYYYRWGVYEIDYNKAIVKL